MNEYAILSIEITKKKTCCATDATKVIDLMSFFRSKYSHIRLHKNDILDNPNSPLFE